MGHKFTSPTWMSIWIVVIGLCYGVGIVLGHQNQAYGTNTQQHAHGHQQPPQQNAQQQGGSPGHGHAHGGPQQGVFDRSQVQDREHIKEHLDGVAQADTSKMSEQELQFHYFKMHDSDNNNKLDGCELIKSLIHWHEEDKPASSPDNQSEPLRIFQDEELSSMVDSILVQDDRNQDGFIDYLEYMEMLKNPVTEENNPNNPNRPPSGPKVFVDNELEVLIDPILTADDTNRDGFIDYAEFAAAQSRMAAAGPVKQR